MKVYVKNKLISLRGSSSVKNEAGENLFYVKGRFFSPTHRKYICDLNGNKLYKVRNKWINIWFHRAFIYDANNTKIAKVKHHIFAGKKFVVEGYKDEIVIDGNFFSMESTIRRNGEVIGKITRNFALTDTFCIDAKEEDVPFIIALVIAIDNILDKYLKN